VPPSKTPASPRTWSTSAGACGCAAITGAASAARASGGPAATTTAPIAAGGTTEIGPSGPKAGNEPVAGFERQLQGRSLSLTGGGAGVLLNVTRKHRGISSGVDNRVALPCKAEVHTVTIYAVGAYGGKRACFVTCSLLSRPCCSAPPVRKHLPRL